MTIVERGFYATWWTLANDSPVQLRKHEMGFYCNENENYMRSQCY